MKESAMPSEADLRKEFHDNEPGGAIDHGAIDLDAVLRRSRARRRPRVVAAALVSSLAVLGIVVPVSISLASTHPTSALSAGSAASAPDAAAGPVRLQGESTSVSALGLDRCGATLVMPSSAPNGLVLTVSPVVAAATAREIPVTVTLTNTGGSGVTGMISAQPLLTLSKGSVVLWHDSVDWQVGKKIDLSPGDSTTLSATFDPVICSVEDDDTVRTDLPDAGPGAYQLSAALDFSPQTAGDGSGGGAVLVTGPTSPVTLH
jgi:hypothetical protein